MPHPRTKVLVVHVYEDQVQNHINNNSAVVELCGFRFFPRKEVVLNFKE